MTKRKWIFLFLCSLSVATLSFRLVNLDGKNVWGDEGLTLLWVSGYTQQVMHRDLFKRHVVSGDEVLVYQTVTPGKGVWDTVKAVAVNSPMHAPGYYYLARAVASPEADALHSSRMLSASLSILQIPLAFWLASELSGSIVAAMIAAALLATSPFQFLYAQEAREYSAWGSAILLSCSALLVALRVGTRRAWTGYGLSMVVCLYFHTLSFLLLAGHALFVFITRRSLIKGSVRAFVKQSIYSLLIFSPWLLIICCSIPIVKEHYQWVESPLELGDMVRTLSRNPVRLFFDFESAVTWVHGGKLVTVISVLVLLTEFFCVWLVSKKNKRAAIFLATMSVPIGAFLLLPDLMLGGQRSTTIRYWMPFLLALQITVALAFDELLKARSQTRLFGVSITAIFITASMFSCMIVSSSPEWWNKDFALRKYFEQRATNYKSLCYFAAATFTDDMVLLVLGHAMGKNTVTLVTDAEAATLSQQTNGKAVILNR